MKTLMILAGAVTLAFAAYADKESVYEGVEYVLNEDDWTAKAVKNYYAVDDFVIPEKLYGFSGEEYTVTAIGPRAFFSSLGLNTLKLPESVKTIEEAAFRCCFDLYHVEMPGVEMVGRLAFDGCPQLLDVNLPKARFVGKDAFDNSLLLTRASLPEVEVIGEGAFAFGDRLSRVEIPKVRWIGKAAFSACPKLTSVSLPAVTNIGAMAFSGCTQLATVSFGTLLQPPTFGTNCFANVAYGCVGVISEEAEAAHGAEWDAAFAAAGLQKSVQIIDAETDLDEVIEKVRQEMTWKPDPKKLEEWQRRVRPLINPPTFLLPQPGVSADGDVFAEAAERLREIVGDKAFAIFVVRKLIDASNLKFSTMGSANEIPLPFPKMVIGFIDEAPGANWSHPCSLVLFNEDLSNAVKIPLTEPPCLSERLNGTESPLVLAPAHTLSIDQAKEAVEARIEALRQEKGLREANELRAGIRAADPDVMLGNPSNSYFLVVAGGANPPNNGLRFWADAAMYYSTLRIKYGVPKENIALLVSDGGATNKDAIAYVADGGTNYQDYVSSPADMDGDGVDDVTGPANFETLRKTLKAFEKKLTPADQLTVFISSHGSPIGESSPSNHNCAAWLFDRNPSRQEIVRDWQLELLTKRINCPVGFAIETCYSGGFIDNITNTSKRVIATACRHDQFSFGSEGAIPVEDLETFDGAIGSHNSWALPFNCAVRCRVPSSVIWADTYPWGSGLIDLTPAVDTNGDGRVSFGEAFVFSLSNDTCAVVGREPYEEPQLGESEPGFAERFFTLKPLFEFESIWRPAEGVAVGYGSGILAIRGTNAVPDYAEGAAPWAAFLPETTVVSVGGDVPRIGVNAFEGLNEDAHVNGMSVSAAASFAGALGAPIEGAVSADVEAIEIVNGKALLNVSVCTNDNLTTTTEGWQKARVESADVEDDGTVTLTVPAPADKGFMILKTRSAAD